MTSHDGFETLAIHAGQEPDPLTGAVVPPIYQVSTYKQDGVGGLRGGPGAEAGQPGGTGEARGWFPGYDYSRTANPTRAALEECLAAIEGGTRPIALGADVVVHSTTKYLGGHSDVVGGALVLADAGLGGQLAFNQNATGAVAGPFDAWLTLRGIKTLAVSMDRHCANAARIA